MSRVSRLIATVGSLAATLLLGVAFGQTSTESKTWEVVAVQGNTVVAKGPDGTKEYNLPPDFKMDMDGKPIAVSDLKPGMTVHATITTKVTSHPVYTTEVKNGEVMAVRGYTVVMKTDAGYQQFTPERMKSGDVMIFKGVIDCSANPNYPAADAGNLYKVSVAGKIGGASGPNVEAGDTLYCITDSTASGNHATVGANWVIAQVNIDGAVTGPASATDNALVLFNGTGGKVVKDSAVTVSTDGTFAANSDSKVSTEKAIKTYVASQTTVLPAAFYPGTPTASALVLYLPFAIAVTLPANLAGSYVKAKTAATASTAFDVQKNGSSVGTITFAASGSTATFSTTGGAAVSFAAGDVISIVSPATPDATLSDIGFSLLANR